MEASWKYDIKRSRVKLESMENLCMVGFIPIQRKLVVTIEDRSSVLSGVVQGGVLGPTIIIMGMFTDYYTLFNTVHDSAVPLYVARPGLVSINGKQHFALYQFQVMTIFNKLNQTSQINTLPEKED